MSIELTNQSAGTNLCTNVKLDGLQVMIWSNGTHDVGTSVDHTHAGYELMSSLSGSYSIAGKKGILTLRARETACLIPPGYSHRCRHAEEGARQVALSFSLQHRPGKSAPFAAAAQLLPTEEPILLKDETLCALLGIFSRELTETGLGAGKVMELLLQQIVIQLLRCVKKHTDALESQELTPYDLRNDRFNRIEAFFTTQYAQPITEDDLARELSISRRQTSRILRQYCGKSFQQKKEDLRMHYARRYLIETEIPVEEVAFRVGYTSAAGFFVAFRKQHGITPAQFRQKEKTM